MVKVELQRHFNFARTGFALEKKHGEVRNSHLIPGDPRTALASRKTNGAARAAPCSKEKKR
jgi:hypothetical protein